MEGEGGREGRGKGGVDGDQGVVIGGGEPLLGMVTDP